MAKKTEAQKARDAAERQYYGDANRALKNINRYDAPKPVETDGPEGDDCLGKIFQFFFVAVAIVSYFS